MNKTLSPGDKKYYGISYKVLELTNGKRKQVNDLIALQNKSENEDVVSESELFEGRDVRSEVIDKLSQFFSVSTQALMKFKFDGTDDIKAVTKALNGTNYEGVDNIVRVAILSAKRDLGL